MAFITPSFRDITMEDQYMTCKIGLAKFNGRFRRAQIWLDRTLFEKMTPVVPYKTGAFLSRLRAANAGRWGSGEIVTSVPPQGRRLYGGINPNTGIPFHWTNPLTQPRWGTYTYMTYKAEFVSGIKQILLRGSYPNG